MSSVMVKYRDYFLNLNIYVENEIHIVLISRVRDSRMRTLRRDLG